MTDAATRLSTALAGRYALERLIGEGGMATVFLARDLKHDRPVAIKLLKPEVAESIGAERFEREIKVAAKLSHPNILGVYDSGGAGSDLFYVMPYVEGETLRDRLRREPPLTGEEIIRIGTQVAAALDYAHRHGVVHRDVKPENILLHEGVAMVADFGIALAPSSADETRMTRSGLFMGTPQYMSPEQASGSTTIDARSDVYSLGAVIYELVCGDPPFSGDSPQGVIAKVLTERPTPLRRNRDSVPPAVEGTVMKALSRAPSDRFPTARAFGDALSGSSMGPAAPTDSKPSVVVLPFANRSGDPENEYFSDGLSEEVMTDLAQVSGLRVISRNSAMQLKGTTKSTVTLATELGVSHVVTGSVRRAGDALRVTAELVEAATDTTVWSDKYSGTMADVFGIQEEIARRIVEALEVTLTATEDRKVAERPIDDTVAYDCYLRARQQIYAFSPAAMDSAKRLVDEALAIVGDSPLLLATRAEINWMYVNALVRPDESYLRSAEADVRRVLSLDPAHYLGLLVRGALAAQRGDIESAFEDLDRALALGAGDATVLTEVIRFSNVAGRRRHGRYVEELWRIDPLTPVTPLCSAFYHLMRGEPQEAATPARRVIELMPVMSPMQIFGAWTLAHAARREEAADVLARVERELSGTVVGSLAGFLGAGVTGDADRAIAAVTPDLERAAAFEDFHALIMADAYAAIGRVADANRWLRTAVGRSFLNFPFLAEHDAFFDDLRRDSDFRQLVHDEVQPRWERLVAAEARSGAERGEEG